MHVLLTGANGFIGRNIAAGLLQAGHTVRAAVRDPGQIARRFPAAEAVACDMNRDVTAAAWVPRLVGVDAVVNCAGILQQSRRQSIEAIHAAAPIALFDACATAGVRRVVQISAISADTAAGTAYARTKKLADDHLRTLDLDWVVLRPSLVYAEGSYGGSSLLRGLAGLPLAIPLVGSGNQPFQPIHADDLAKTVLRALTIPSLARITLEPVGPERLSLRDLVLKLRAWLDLPPAPTVAVPMPLIRAAARIGDWTGGGPLNSTALRQLEYGNAAPSDPFVAAIGFAPRSLDEALAARPSHVQDRWHARLYFARPLLRLSLALLWVVSGVVGLTAASALTHPPVAALGVPATLVPAAVAASSLLDIVIGAAVGLRYRPGALAAAQLAVIGLYTLLLTIVSPGLWGDPFGPLLKNLPIVGAVLALWAIEEDR